MKNQVVQMLVPNEATGYKLIKLATNWNGTCFVVPRPELKEIEKRPEIHEPGLYFLFGENDESTNQTLYIGESERFFDRLQSHDARKDFWNIAIVFTGGLDKAKIKYLEHLSIAEAAKVSRYALLNSSIPRENSLSEFDVAATRDYFNKIDYLLTVLGHPVFKKVNQLINHSTFYYIKADSANARAQLLADGSFNVLKGSLSRIRETNSFWGWALSARKKFLEDGTFQVNDATTYVFTRDVLFKSPSAAASVIKGRSTNGWTSWKDEKGHTLDENLRK